MSRVEFVEHKERRFMLPVKNHYEFKPKGRLQFLQHWAWNLLLHRFKALEQAQEEHVEYTRHVIDTNDVVERLIRQRINLLRGYNKEPTEVLIGSEDFAEMMNSPRFHHEQCFDATYYRSQQLMGLKVRVIPWMRGMVVMP